MLFRNISRVVALLTRHSDTDIFARAADQILTIGEGGHVSSALTPQEAGLGSPLTTEAMLKLPLSISAQASEAAPPELPADKEISTEEVEDDAIVRQRGDLSLYVLYFKPVLGIVLAAWLVTTMLYSLAERASGMETKDSIPII